MMRVVAEGGRNLNRMRLPEQHRKSRRGTTVEARREASEDARHEVETEQGSAEARTHLGDKVANVQAISELRELGVPLTWAIAQEPLWLLRIRLPTFLTASRLIPRSRAMGARWNHLSAKRWSVSVEGCAGRDVTCRQISSQLDGLAAELQGGPRWPSPMILDASRRLMVVRIGIGSHGPSPRSVWQDGGHGRIGHGCDRLAH